jgi:hypothetical protein
MSMAAQPTLQNDMFLKKKSRSLAGTRVTGVVGLLVAAVVLSACSSSLKERGRQPQRWRSDAIGRQAGRRRTWR